MRPSYHTDASSSAETRIEGRLMKLLFMVIQILYLHIPHSHSGVLQMLSRLSGLIILSQQTFGVVHTVNIRVNTWFEQFKLKQLRLLSMLSWDYRGVCHTFRCTFFPQEECKYSTQWSRCGPAQLSSWLNMAALLIPLVFNFSFSTLLPFYRIAK